MENLNSDKDSLVALESLLRIGTSGRNGEAQEASLPPPPPSQTTIPAMTNILPQSLAGAGILFPHQAAGYSHVQLAAAQAALAAAANATYQQTINVGDLENKASMITTKPSSIAETPTKISYTSHPRGVSRGESQQPIRKDKVEAALRSKPQRGRKRDDLSDKERLELTRSRNREHAKTTR